METLTRQEFYDNIPNFLECFSARLRSDAAAPAVPARQHGAHRWQQGLSFEEVIHEWGLLHRILIERIGGLWASVGLAADSLQQVYGLLAETVENATALSLTEYHTRQRVEAETRMYDLEAVLERRDDMDHARGQGLHQASHDLRGSLQLIQVSCHLLQQQPLNEQARTIVERLTQAGESLNFLFSDLLDLARLEAGREPCHWREFDAAELFHELVTATRSSAEAEGLTLTVTGQDKLRVRSDAAKLRRIAQNLILNALNHTTVGGVEIGWHAESPRRWSFYIQDTGPGLRPASENPLAANLEQAEYGVAKTRQPKTHAASESDKPAGSRHTRVRGEGIGLAIVHQLCELLDAVLEIDSQSGRGTTFRVELPLQHDNEALKEH